MGLNIIICDDEFLHRLILKEFLITILNEEFLEYDLIEYSSGKDLINNYNKADLLFLDIQMNELSGMDVARKIRELDNNVEIIFTTAIEKYVFEAYEVRAYRYLLKPIEYEKLKRQVKLCISDYLIKNSIISIDTNKVTIKIPIGEILYAEVMKKEVTIHTESKIYTIEISMKRVEKKLLNYGFFRCHHSYLVNLNKISEIRNKTIFINDNEIPISRTRYKSLKIKLVNLLGDSLC
ncbi:TPA: LytR/AlgR family response regulator transcription factor [Clostridium perfringens]|uniref:Stage 0 sporulation protein A homolog n=1 Tax=Clostridium perfringens TaxID=1502 RepID=F7J0E7_CLOPF|nr:LytTR family DNA-binding domain-containing protein [Clostridium perfringens]EGT4138657.1 response regulator transcription factor [Clostridium perfringens]UBL00723.1 LytTR family DNA-binding domain-containing protein [Clostridium perfringens]BAK40988.1 putative VirR protein [Clostridium perfringens]BDC03366.1 DNA-binding response regulator [Clostridium perfringens E]